MIDNNKNALVAMAKDREISLNPAMINRHGLITGATGTGKTVSLQTLAETFSALGVPVFMADVKGDLSGLAKKGSQAGKQGERAAALGLAEKGYKPQAFPVTFWDVYGREGHPLRATISDLGPILLARLMGLNDVQSGVLNIVFRIADDQGLLLLDIKDLRSMCAAVNEERDKYRAEYGQISPASIGAIQRALLRLEEEGGDLFFGEPALDINDLLQTDKGKGVINILDATRLINAPNLYSCVLLWLLSELFERLPERGDQPLPVFAFFFDEAHLLFDGIEPALLQKIEQMARLIRSRGVGVYFVSQNPADIPDSILGQLGNRIQHALRAFTPKDQKAVRAAAQAFRPNPAFSTEEAIAGLGIGEALVSFLDGNGAPAIVEKAMIVPPQSQIGPIDGREREKLMASSLVAGVYDKPVDRESAYEILAGRATRREEEKARLQQEKDAEKKRREWEKEQEKERKRLEAEERRQAKARKDNPGMGDIFGNMMKQTTRAATSAVGRELGRTILRGLMGSLFGGRR